MFRRILILLALLAVLGLSSAPDGSADSPSGCSLYAAPAGSDTAPGTSAAPFATVDHLVASLSAGQTGCLRTGTYQGDASADSYREIKFEKPGVTLTSAPGEQATIVGRVWIAEGADGVTVSDLILDGANARSLPSPTVNARGATFSHLDVSNDHTAICFALGNVTWGRAVGTTIADSRIHGCGELPSTNQEHGIYLSAATDTTIRDNWIYDNADRGIQLYPDAQHTVITGNVIYANGTGIIFSGNDTVAADGNSVTGNIISNSTVRRNVESSYDPNGPHGTGNAVTGNCVHGAYDWYAGADGSGIQNPQDGFTATGNVNQQPQFVDASHGDLRLAAGSPCASVLPAAATAEVPGALTETTAPDAGLPQAPVPAATLAATAPDSGTVSIRPSRHAVHQSASVRIFGVAKGTPAVRFARVYARSASGWRSLGGARVRGDGSFVVTASLRGHGRVGLRASVPGVGHSRVVRVRVT